MDRWGEGDDEAPFLLLNVVVASGDGLRTEDLCTISEAGHEPPGRVGGGRGLCEVVVLVGDVATTVRCLGLEPPCWALWRCVCGLLPREGFRGCEACAKRPEGESGDDIGGGMGLKVLPAGSS